jgi:hypothetical protein
MLVTSEREATRIQMMKRHSPGSRHLTLGGAIMLYDAREFVDDLRDLNVTPLHCAKHDPPDLGDRCSYDALHGLGNRPTEAQAKKSRLAGPRLFGGFARPMLCGVARLRSKFTAMAAYDLIRLPNLLGFARMTNRRSSKTNRDRLKSPS